MESPMVVLAKDMLKSASHVRFVTQLRQWDLKKPIFNFTDEVAEIESVVFLNCTSLSTEVDWLFS